MKLKKTIIVAITLFLLSSSFLVASDNVTSYLFKGELFINNEIVDLKQDLYSINGSVYVPVRALAEKMKGYISYDKSNQSVHIEQANASDKKSTVNETTKNDQFTLSAFSSKSTFQHGDQIEIWSRLVNYTEHPVNILHGVSLIEYHITDDDGFTSKEIYGLPLLSSTFQAGDELNSNIKQNAFLTYNLNKIGFDNRDDLYAFNNESARPSVLPRGNYIITVTAQYTIDGNDSNKVKTLEVAIPLIIE